MIELKRTRHAGINELVYGIDDAVDNVLGLTSQRVIEPLHVHSDGVRPCVIHHQCAQVLPLVDR